MKLSLSNNHFKCMEEFTERKIQRSRNKERRQNLRNIYILRADRRTKNKRVLSGSSKID